MTVLAPRLRRLQACGVVAIVMFVCVTIFYLFGGWYPEYAEEAFARTFGDVLSWKSRWIAGRNAVNCGVVPVKGNPDDATDCTLRAFAAHRPFRVRYGLQTYDTVMAAGVVASPDGRIYELLFSGGTPTGITDLFRQRVLVNACPINASLRRTAKRRITCIAPGKQTPANWISSWLSDAP